MKTLFKVSKVHKAFVQKQQYATHYALGQVKYLPWAFGAERGLDPAARLTSWAMFQLGIRRETSIYRSFFDKTFDADEFVKGCREAIPIAREMLFKHDIEGLTSVLTSDCMANLFKYY